MIDTQAIRSKILDLAMRGQLTEQLPEDGNAEELYQQILEEKQKLIKEGKIKKQKPLPEITDEEIPFDIPDNWKWVKLLNICYSIYAGKDKPKDFVTEKDEKHTIPVVANAVAKDGIMGYTSTATANAGTLTVAGRGTIGFTCFRDYDYCPIVRLLVIDISNWVYPQYIKFVFQQLTFDSVGSSIPQLTVPMIRPKLIPLPPLAEQERIVEKIEQAFYVLDIIDKLQAQYADNLTALKSKLIDAAIQGKLTEQLPEDGTAEEIYQQIQEEKQKLIKEGKIKKQKPLPEISDDEIPFDIPKNWKWKRFADVLDVRDGTHDTPKYVTEGIPLVTSKNLRKGLIDFESAKLISYEDAKQINNRSRVDDGDILLAMIGTIGNPVLVKKDREFSIKNMALFKPIDSNLLDMSYVLYYLKNEERVMQEKARGGLQPFVSLKLLRTSIIPLPPLTEQKRIVQKLNVILPLCK